VSDLVCKNMANENGVESFTCLLVSCDPVLQIRVFVLFLFFYEDILEDIACPHVNGEWRPLAAASWCDTLYARECSIAFCLVNILYS